MSHFYQVEANKRISIGFFSRAVVIAIRPNDVQRFFERNVKCNVTFFRLIKYKIFTIVYEYVINSHYCDCKQNIYRNNFYKQKQ